MPPAQALERYSTAAIRSDTISFSLQAAALGCVYLLAALAGIALTREAGNVAAIWPPNAVLLAVLLRSDRQRWPPFLLACALANFAANMLAGDTMTVSAGFALVNMTEVLVGCGLIWIFCGHPVTLTNIRQLVAFAGLAGLAAPLVGAFAGAGLVSLTFDAPYWAVWRVWWVADAMGILIVAPVILAWNRGTLEALRSGRLAAENAALLVAATAATWMLFRQETIPWLFIVPPILLWAALRLGLFATALAGLLVSATAVWLTIDLSGPIAALPNITVNERVLFLQLFLGTTVLAPLLVAVSLGERQQAAAALSHYSQDLEISNRALETAVSERDLLLKELQHRVKNNLQVVVSLLNLRSDDDIEDAAKQAILEASHRIEALALAHHFFYRPDQPNRLPVAAYIPELCALLTRVYAVEADRVEIKTEIEDVTIPIDKATPLALLLNELISNAFKHAFPGTRRGQITIRFGSALLGDDARIARVTISDDGIGLANHIDVRTGDTTGFKVIQGLTDQLDGRIDVRREQGLTIHISFPFAPGDAN